MQGLFVLTVGYVYMTTYPLTKYDYIMERVCFIYRLFILFISTLSSVLFLYKVSWRYKRDYLHASIDILFLSSMLLTLWKNIRHFYTMSVLTIQKRSRFEPCPPLSTICIYAPVSMFFFYFSIDLLIFNMDVL